jgi:hypothetical protein
VRPTALNVRITAVSVERMNLHRSATRRVQTKYGVSFGLAQLAKRTARNTLL